MASYNVSEAKKGKGIDEIIFRLQPQPVDDLKIVPSSAPNQFQDLLAKYQRFLDRSIEAKGGIYGWYTAMEKAVEQYFPERLTPAEINIFLQMSMGTEGHPNYNRADYIITQLIQNSYDAGYNDFTLSTAALNEKIALWSLRGRPQNILRVTIDGDAGYTSFPHSRYVEGRIRGNAYACGAGSSDSAFIIGGNDLGDLGWAYFDDGMSAEWSERCSFTVRGTVGKRSGLRSSACLFRVFSREAAEQLCANVPPGNKVILVAPDGREDTIKRIKKQTKR